MMSIIMDNRINVYINRQQLLVRKVSRKCQSSFIMVQYKAYKNIFWTVETLCYQGSYTVLHYSVNENYNRVEYS